MNFDSPSLPARLMCPGEPTAPMRGNSKCLTGGLKASQTRPLVIINDDTNFPKTNRVDRVETARITFTVIGFMPRWDQRDGGGDWGLELSGRPQNSGK